MKAFLCGLVCLLAASMATAQANSQPELKTRANQVQELQPGDDSSSVAPDAPVITINGGKVPIGAVTAVSQPPADANNTNTSAPNGGSATNGTDPTNPADQTSA